MHLPSGLALAVVVVYLGLVGLLSLYGLHRLLILALYARHRGPDRACPALPRGEEPRVTVQLPLWNERSVVERLIDHVAALDWPADRLQIQVLDDSTDETTALALARAAAWQARGVEVTVLRRASREGYKAGALAEGLRSAKGELICIFDADFLPEPGFLRRIVPHFQGRPELGMVQARWGHDNEHHNLLTRLSSVLLDGHFVLEHTARHRSGRFFNFNGTAGVWRRACIEAAGGWQHDTLTEDLDLSYRAQLQGWRFLFLRDLVVPAELPEAMTAFKSQQHRWAKGTMQTARKLLPGILRAPLSLRVRGEAAVHLTNNLAYPMVLVVALLLPLAVAARAALGLEGLLGLDLAAWLLSTGSVGLFYAVAEREAHGRLLDRLWRIPLVMALGIGLAVNQSRAVVEGLFGQDRSFVRTPKSGGGAVRYALPGGWTPWAEISLALYELAAIGVAVREGWWASLPFLTLFAVGFAYVGLGSLAGTSWGMRVKGALTSSQSGPEGGRSRVAGMPTAKRASGASQPVTTSR